MFGGDLGQAYLGVNRCYQRDFNREWAESFRVKHQAPLGEDELARMTRKKK